METALNSAMSGLRAASRRLEVSASNTVNAQSENYTPSRVVQTALATGGTKAEAIPIIDPPTVSVYAPQSPVADAEGIVERPNVALESEFVEQKLALHAYEANLRTLATADRMAKTVLDILA